MQEAPRKFIIEKVDEESDMSVLQEQIQELRERALSHEDFDKTIQFNDAIADFQKKLLEMFIQEDLIQIPEYHQLIGSGIATGTTFEVKVEPLIEQMVVNRIQEFTIAQLSLLNA